MEGHVPLVERQLKKENANRVKQLQDVTNHTCDKENKQQFQQKQKMLYIKKNQDLTRSSKIRV